jgi:hypothetical protein
MGYAGILRNLWRVYEDDECFLSTLEEFIWSAFDAGEGVVIIATDVHINAMNERLQKRGLNVDRLRR